MVTSTEEQYIEQVKTHEGIMHKVIGLYTDTEADRKDLHQEILLQSWKAYPKFRGDAKFSTWLYKISLNTALTFRKSSDRQSLIKESPPPEESINSNTENHELLYAIVKRLDKVDRMLISLHLDGYGNKEIAGITGMTQNHVNVKIHRLKKQIINEFKKH